MSQVPNYHMITLAEEVLFVLTTNESDKYS